MVSGVRSGAEVQRPLEAERPKTPDSGHAQFPIENWISNRSPVGLGILSHLSAGELHQLAQVSHGIHDNLLPTDFERSARNIIAELEGQHPTKEEWDRIGLINLPGSTADTPATSLMRLEHALATAEPESVTIKQVRETPIQRPFPPGAYFRQFYDAYGNLIVVTEQLARVHAGSGKFFDVLPPPGWKLVFPPDGLTLTTGSVVKRPFACLIENRETRQLGLLTMRTEDQEPHVHETSLFPSMGATRHSPSGRYAAWVDPSQAICTVKLYDAGTICVYEGSGTKTRPQGLSVADNGLICWVSKGQYVRLAPDPSSENLQPANHLEANTADDFSVYLSSPKGDFLVKEVRNSNESRKLVVEGLRSEPIWLDPGERANLVTKIAISAQRKLVAVLYSDCSLVLYSLSGDLGDESGTEGAGAIGGILKASVVARHQFPQPFALSPSPWLVAKMTFGNTADELKFLTRHGDDLIETTFKLSLPMDASHV